jgi:hypothetical protein
LSSGRGPSGPSACSEWLGDLAPDFFKALSLPDEARWLQCQAALLTFKLVKAAVRPTAEASPTTTPRRPLTWIERRLPFLLLYEANHSLRLHQCLNQISIILGAQRLSSGRPDAAQAFRSAGPSEGSACSEWLGVLAPDFLKALSVPDEALQLHCQAAPLTFQLVKAAVRPTAEASPTTTQRRQLN